jgi:hypothetical protein
LCSHEAKAYAKAHWYLQQEDVMTKLYLNAAAGALMAALIAIPAYALDVSVGGNSSGGTSAGASQGDTSANATIGGGGNVANGRIGTGGNAATFSIGSGSGPLVSGSSTGAPLDGTSTTNAAVNLGGILGGVPGVPGGGGGGISPDQVAAAVAAGGGNLGQLKVTCAGVLGAPARYDVQLVQLCRVLMNL